MPDKLFQSGYLTGIVREFKPDATMRAAALFPSIRVPADFYMFDTVSGTRVISDFRDPRAQAGVQKLTDRARTKVLMAHMRDKKYLDDITSVTIDGVGSVTPEDKLAAVKRELEDLDGIVERTIEHMRWRVLLTGQFQQSSPVVLDYDFGLDNKSTLAGAAAWTEANLATMTPLEDIAGWIESVRISSGEEPEEIWMSTATLRLVMRSNSVQLVLDDETKREYRRTAKIAELGGLKVVLYDGGYLDASDTFQRYMSSDGSDGDMVVVKAAGPVGKTAYGLAKDSDAPAGFYGKFVKSETEFDPSTRQILECCSVIVGLEKRNNLWVAQVR